ncbi:hypothetical protein K492DRAFT_187287 [Lichtheimia hyalospora FSU 10163]|nr:hypothetical protein K492DRAFT_187287 [Lichtheimia hyalospora FSU 10163]
MSPNASPCIAQTLIYKLLPAKAAFGKAIHVFAFEGVMCRTTSSMIFHAYMNKGHNGQIHITYIVNRTRSAFRNYKQCTEETRIKNTCREGRHIKQDISLVVTGNMTRYER